MQEILTMKNSCVTMEGKIKLNPLHKGKNNIDMLLLNLARLMLVEIWYISKNGSLLEVHLVLFPPNVFYSTFVVHLP